MIFQDKRRELVGTFRIQRKCPSRTFAYVWICVFKWSNQ